MRLALPVLLSFSFAMAGPNDWPGWRGPSGNGISTLKNIPVSWSADRNIAWKTPVEGRGHSSPVVWGDRIFLTTDLPGEEIPGNAAPKHRIRGDAFHHPDAGGANRKHTLKVMCFDANNGKQLW